MKLKVIRNQALNLHSNIIVMDERKARIAFNKRQEAASKQGTSQDGVGLELSRTIIKRVYKYPRLLRSKPTGAPCVTLNRILISLMTLTAISQVILPFQTVQALWFFNSNLTSVSTSAEQQNQQQQEALQQQVQNELNQQALQEDLAQQQQLEPGLASPPSAAGGYAGYGSNLLAIAGIRPASIASILNTVGDTGFRYFNIQDQCRNRAACDLGYMLYKKLSFVHNWLIRTSVRSLTDMNNIYTQSWMEGMLGRNCTTVYATCRQSPLEGLMSLAFVQQLAVNQ